ncbi:recombinase family protein [Streptomyces sp. NPDC060223]|uniref:recombinase family protein n=1 Tax=unclassified Streptomyces TaxID=2593676 RepID=UPI003632630A
MPCWSSSGPGGSSRRAGPASRRSWSRPGAGGTPRSAPASSSACARRARPGCCPWWPRTTRRGPPCWPRSSAIRARSAGKLAVDDRPGLTAALDYLRAGDILTVQEVDRLGRNLLEGLIVLNDAFQRGIAVKVLEGIAVGEHTERSLILDLALALAEDRRRDIVKKTKNGLDSARARGRVGGRRPVVDDDKRRVILARRAEGQSIREIAVAVKVSVGVVHKPSTPPRRACFLPMGYLIPGVWARTSGPTSCDISATAAGDGRHPLPRSDDLSRRISGPACPGRQRTAGTRRSRPADLYLRRGRRRAPHPRGLPAGRRQRAQRPRPARAAQARGN